MTSENIYYELGDHAANDIAAVSATRRKPVPIEDHFDDCGDDVSALELPELTAFATCFDSEDEPSSEEDELFSSSFFSFYGFGSSYICSDTNLSSFAKVYAVVNSWPAAKGVDYVELFGGNAGTTRIAIRRNLKGGKNFDLTSGVNLHNPDDVRALFDYLRTHRPLVVIMGPPCTAFGSWSSWNAIHNWAGYNASLQEGLPLAKLAARIAKLQHEQGRFFVCENPWLSKLWYLPCWQALLQLPEVLTAYADQCAYGLVTIDGEPTKKPTAFVANHPALLHFLQRTCSQDHVHTLLAGQSQGISRCKFAQAWTPALCTAIVNGILRLKLLQHYLFFPVAVSQESCPACKQHMAADDNRHIRQGNCRFPSAVPANWLCEACSQHKHSRHNGHTQVPGECRWASVMPRASGSRNTATVRVPHVPAHTIVEDEEQAETQPPATTLGNWFKVVDLDVIAALDDVRDVNGWCTCLNSPTLVLYDARYIRTAEPRLEAKLYDTRCVYALFPEHPHQHSCWWQVQQHADALVSLAIGYKVPVLVTIFHETVGVPSVKIKPEGSKASSSKAQSSSSTADGTAPVPKRQLQPEDSDPWVNKYPWASRNPVQAEDDGEGNEEAVPDELGPVDVVLDPPDWSSWDLGRALRALRGSNEAIINRTLRKLHLRWWHASKSRMESLLRAAGLPKSVLNAVGAVTDTCRVCRLWKRPTSRPQATLRQSVHFNEAIQVDLLFVSNLIVLHIVDECIRWSSARVIKSKTVADILSGLLHGWFAIFGPPGVIVSDREGSLMSEEAAIFLERHGTSLRPKPKGSHAQIVERHHEILRQVFHRVKSQSLEEGLVISDEDLLAECVFAKNALLIVHGESPYQALLGRSPELAKRI